MRDGLLDGKRDQFFLDVIHHLADAGVKALAAIDDRNHPVANIPDLGSAPPTHEIDATFLLFERINRLLSEMGEDAVVINDRPSGNSRIEEENKFLANALDIGEKELPSSVSTESQLIFCALSPVLSVCFSAPI